MICDQKYPISVILLPFHHITECLWLFHLKVIGSGLSVVF